MSVPEQDPVTLHTGNGVTTVFAFQFLLTSALDLVVTVDDVLKVKDVDYTIAGLGVEAGGDVTFISGAPALGLSVILHRVIVPKRDTDYQYAGDFNAGTVNADFDRVWQAQQGTNEELDRAVRVPLGSPINPDDLINDLVDASETAVLAAAAAAAAESSATASAAAAAASAASTGLPALTGKTLNLLRVKADETGYETRTPAQTRSDLGATTVGASVFTAATSAAARTAIGSPALGVLVAVTAYTASGTHTTNAATKTMIGQVVGGGGGGGGTSAAGVANAGGGGGQGEIGIFSITTPAASYVVTVGAGGAGGLNSGGTGGTGGVSSLGAAVTAFGGVGGEGDGGQSGGYGGLGGLGGTGALLAIRGASGAAGSPGGSFGNSGSGGGPGGGNGIRNNSGVGVPGVRGGGGSGAAGTTATGGPGGAGYIIVWEYA